MNDLNTVIIKGNLVHDPEAKLLPNGMAICTVAIANNRQRKVGENWKDEVHYFDVTIFGKQAENLVKHKRKGDPVIAEGRLAQSRWQDESSGQKRQRVSIVADVVHWLNRGQGTGSGGQGTGSRVQGTGEGVPHNVAQAFTDAQSVDEGEIPF